MKILKTIAAIIGFTIPLSLLAAGIQVSPDKLNFVVASGKQTSQNITVVNPSPDVQIFEVYADNFTDSIKAMPQSFTLESGGSKVVSITVDSATTNNQAGQKLATNLSVVGKPLADNKFSVGTGVKIPLTLSLESNLPQTDKKQIAFYALALVALVALLWGLNYKKFKRQN